MKCEHCQKEVPFYKKNCPHCEAKMEHFWVKLISSTQQLLIQIMRLLKKMFSYLYKRVIFYAKWLKPRLKSFFSVKRNTYITLAVLGSLIVLLTIIGLVNNNKSSDILSLGSKEELLTSSVDTNGGLIEVKDTGSGLDGLTIEIPSASYQEQTSFEIFMQPIESHDLGDYFNPITPLITIDNHEVFADKPLYVDIPITISSDEFAMGFYYDATLNTLEAIPTKAITETSITLITSHFSSIVVSKIDIEVLKNLSQAIDPYTDTGFVPGTDDWHFTNYGSYLEKNGHCAGQVLTMSWYYSEKKIKEDEPSLNGLFDNQNFEPTENLWEDDRDAYRFASVVQNMLDFGSDEFFDYLNFSGGDQSKIYYAFSYAMVMTKSPQLMGIYAHDEFGNIVSGHAILAYQMKGKQIYVADPNYPGQTDRYVLFDTTLGLNEFKPYSSGANARSIQDDGALLYDEILFIGNSALIDYEKIEAAYDDLLEGVSGDTLFPTLDLLYLDHYSNDTSLQTWSEMDQEIQIDDQYNQAMPCFLQDTIVVAASVDHPNAVYYLFEGDQYVSGPKSPDIDGYVYFEIPLIKGMNDFGIYAEIIESGQSYYTDFKRFNIDYEGGVSIPCAATILGRYNFDSRSDGKILVNSHYIEIYADGTFIESYVLISDGYVNTNTGTWEVVEGTEIGQNILELTMYSLTDPYEILDNYQTLKYTSGDIIFIFKKG